MSSGYKHGILVSTDTLIGDAAQAINGNFATIGNLFDAVGISGTSGCSSVGSQGISGFSGYSGVSATGFSGVSGYSGHSGVGISGFSGYSGVSATGISGFSGYSGRSGFSGAGVTATMSPNDTATITFNSGGNNETQYSPSLATISSLTINLPTTTKVGQWLIYICTNVAESVGFNGTVLGEPSLGAMNSGQALQFQAVNTTGTFVAIFTPAS